jgi:hypothetical protein
MPTIITRGAASVRGFGFGGATTYIKPSMILTGPTGTITSNAAGFLLSGFDLDTFSYLSPGKTTGKWYWEATSQNFILFGVTDDPTTNRNYGGYNSQNAGVYALNGILWNEYGTVPVSIGSITPGDTIGFALDVGAQTLAIYVNNVLGDTLTMGSIVTPIYPLFGFQSAPTSQVKLDYGLTYSPPAGFSKY